jgi:hypothetical protein
MRRAVLISAVLVASGVATVSVAPPAHADACVAGSASDTITLYGA